MDNSVIVQIKYTQDEIDRQFIETGIKRYSGSRGGDKREISIDDMTTEQRADLLVVNWDSSYFGASIHHYEIGYQHRTNKPHVANGKEVEFDHVPTDEELKTLMSELAEEKRQCEAQVAELLPAWRIEHEDRQAKQQIEAEEKRKRQEERAKQQERKRQEERQQATIIQWNNDGTALHDLDRAIAIVSELSYDNRFRSWTKEVTSIDRSEKNGYMYNGDFINSGTVELTLGERKIFLVASETGSNKYRTMSYRVVELSIDGKLIKHDIADNDDKPGWALRMRERIAGLLDEQPQQQMVRIPADLAQRIQYALSLDNEELAHELNLLITS